MRNAPAHTNRIAFQSTRRSAADSLPAARAAIAQIVEAGYDVLCAAGGDGTFMAAAGAVIALAPPRPPGLLALRLGTGNAVHDTCGAARPTRRGLAGDLARAADPATPIAPLRLVEVDGEPAQFAGVGLDADWAADYGAVIKRWVGAGPLLPLVRGAPGYAVTALTRTIPRLLARPAVHARVIAEGPALRLGPDGAPLAALADGAVIHDGPLTMASASTVGAYSAGLRYFRHVDRIGDAFELKLAIATPLGVLRHARRVLAGGADPRREVDVAARGVRIELARPTRYHVGGDVRAPTLTLRVALSPATIPVVRLGAPPAGG